MGDFIFVIIVLLMAGVFVLKIRAWLAKMSKEAEAKERQDAEARKEADARREAKAAEDDAMAENGDHEAQFSRGEYYLDHDLKKAKYWFDKAAEHGSSKARDRLKLIDYARSNNVTFAQAKWVAEAAEVDALTENGGLEAQFNRGEYYLFSADYLDLEKAKYWFSKAAKQGSSMAQDRLRLIDDAKSHNVRWMDRNGAGEVTYNGMMEMSSSRAFWADIGNFYLYGCVLEKGNSGSSMWLVDGLERDLEKAEFWFKKAVGHDRAAGAQGLYNVGVSYLNGIGVSVDKNKGRELLSLAAQYGSESARDVLRTVIY